jgi:hypothetical protein
VFAQYADIFAAAGKTTAAKTWNDAAKFSAAKSLGDAKTDKYLYRDPTKGYELLFNADGVAALKEKQAKLGIKVTGKLDAETVNALAKLESSQQVIAGMHCKARSAGTQYFQCDPSNAAPPPGPQVVVVPKVPLN